MRLTANMAVAANCGYAHAAAASRSLHPHLIIIHQQIGSFQSHQQTTGEDFWNTEKWGLSRLIG